LNQWFHIAVTRNGNSYRIFLNGVQVGTTVTDSNSIPASAYRITDSATSGNNVTGYISNLRLVTGTAVYTSNFTPPTSPVTAITNTSLLLNFTNAGIYDAAVQNDLVTVSTSQVSTTRSKWGSSSVTFSTSGGITAPSSMNYSFGTGDFTIEGWFNFSSIGSFNALVDISSGGATPTNQVVVD
jgi:hypothetical protein